ncbi:hypothetical protein T12_9805 [Trichinella patagoniensis]|uniref:Uncharacterized protein n=1 Tax=Trichinella patagoniensis TaxID=990121 RepID=A0A0V1ACE4_9BILA|nr:hypothetical protein T12_9805 [Trichinella patagoniensis]
MRKGHFIEKKWFGYGNLYNNIFQKQKDEILLSAVNKCRTSLEIKTHGVISVPLTVKLHNCMTKYEKISRQFSFKDVHAKTADNLFKIINDNISTEVVRGTRFNSRKRSLQALCHPNPSETVRKQWKTVLSYCFNNKILCWALMSRSVEILEWDCIDLCSLPAFIPTKSKIRFSPSFVSKLAILVALKIPSATCYVRECLPTNPLRKDDYSNLLFNHSLHTVLSIRQCGKKLNDISPVIQTNQFIGEDDVNVFEFDKRLINKLFQLKASRTSRQILFPFVSELLNKRTIPLHFLGLQEAEIDFPQSYSQFYHQSSDKAVQQLNSVALLQAAAFAIIFSDM